MIGKKDSVFVLGKGHVHGNGFCKTECSVQEASIQRLATTTYVIIKTFSLLVTKHAVLT